jgi:hypothetical protein
MIARRSLSRFAVPRSRFEQVASLVAPRIALLLDSRIQAKRSSTDGSLNITHFISSASEFQLKPLSGLTSSQRNPFFKAKAQCVIHQAKCKLPNQTGKETQQEKQCLNVYSCTLCCVACFQLLFSSPLTINELNKNFTRN